MESIRHSRARGRSERRAIVEIAPPIPFAIPRLALQCVLQRCRVGQPRGARAVHRVLAPAARTRRAWRAGTIRARRFRPRPSRRRGSCRRSSRPCRSAAGRVLRPPGSAPAPARSARRARRVSSEMPGWKYASCSPGRSAWPSRNGTLSSRIADVAGRLDVVSGGVRQPDPVIGNARANAGAARPPCPPAATSAARRPRRIAAPAARSRCSRASAGPGQAQRHRVLQLVAESVGAARLIKCRPRPHAAGERLIEHPAIEDDVQRAVRRLHLHRRRARRPSTEPPCARPHRDRPTGNGSAEFAPRVAVAAWPRKKTTSTVSSGRKLHEAFAARSTDRGPRPHAATGAPVQ